MENGAGSGVEGWDIVNIYTGSNRTFTTEDIDRLKEEYDEKIDKLNSKRQIISIQFEKLREKIEELDSSIQTLKITRDSLDAHNNPFKNIISKQRAAEEAPTPTPAAAANDNQKGGSRSKKGKSHSKKGKSRSKKGKSRSKK